MKKIKEEYLRFIKKSFKKYFNSVDEKEQQKVLSELLWIDKYSLEIPEPFINYLFNQNEINSLKQNLDIDSQKELELLLNRLFSPHIKNDFYYRNNKNLAYTKNELELQKEPIINETSYGELKNKDSFIEGVYRYHNGLKCLPKDIWEYIKNKDIIDGGSYTGESAFVFLDYLPSSVHSFEPCTENYKLLVENIEDKKCIDKIIPVNAGIADKEMELNASGDGMGFSILSNDKNNVQKIKCVSIDQYVNKNNLNLGLIKLDIEGVELEAIKGATETIKKFKPVMLISIYHNPKDFFGVKPYIESLGMDYKYMIRKLSNSSLFVETMLICY